VAVPAGGGLRGAVAGSLAGKAVELVTLILLATVVPRALGPSDYGRFSVPLTLVALGSLALTLGGPTLMARYVPAAAPAERVPLALALGARLARGRALQLLAISVAALLASAIAPETVPPATTALVLAALAANVAAALALQIGLGLGRTGAWSLRYPLHNAVLLVAVLVLHDVAGDGGAVAAILVAGLAIAALGLWVLVPLMRQRRAAVALPEGAIRFGVLQAAGAALGQVTQRGGVVLVALLADSHAQTGYAALAIGVSLGGVFAVLQVFTVSLPHVADQKDPEATLRHLADGFLTYLIPGACVGVYLLDRLVPAVFGSDYEGATSAFVPGLAMVVLAPIASLAVQVSALRLRPEAALASGVASIVAFMGVGLAAVPAWGATGATGAALAGMAAGVIVSLQQLPGAVTPRLAGAALGGAGFVVALGVAAT
jgi:O-antigen/teichoic acid export membrane protein